MRAYYKFHCEKCNWEYIFYKEGKEVFEENITVSFCPDCGTFLGEAELIAVSDINKNGEEVKKIEKKHVVKTDFEIEIEEFIKKVGLNARLNSFEQLPDLEGESFVFVFHNAGTLGFNLKYYKFETFGEEWAFIAITEKDKIIWVEPYTYLCRYQRYMQIALIFKEKYGSKMINIVPDNNKAYFNYVGSDAAFEELNKFIQSLK